MKFHYIAFQADGKITENDLESKDVNQVLEYLRDHNLKPVSVKQIEKELGGERRFGKARINLTDQVFLSKYLALMLKMGTGLFQAINILVEDFTKKSVRFLLLEIRAGLEKGQPFYTTFARHPQTFSQVYINLIKAGETSGNLEKVFDNLSEMLTKQKELKDQIRGAMIYPTILLVTSILIVIFLVSFALPKIANVFSESGFQPPFFSRVVFGVGLFFGHYGIWFLLLFVLVFGVFFYLFRSSLVFKNWLMAIIADLPVIKDLFRKIALQRFASILSSLIKAGMSLTEALEVTASAVGNLELQRALVRISREGLSRGLTIGEAFRREPFFPRTVANLVTISEKAGHLEEILSTLADFYTKEIDSSLKALVAFLEPLLLLSIGFIIGLIALAILIPIYQLTSQF
ncbi:hypothetical protein COY65_00370 [Candidatus Jorgensenbacteria bacterium CG_4_10_14_0_8_um_filter_39_13]|uniref:Type II secretion system protein GspF domain-containing protein n=2 Tax=Candidatus Joergenseniibacteriota TaxID=1752739 RepID=A0A2M7RII0_9BACT|nr:MAG: hypothetical protein COV54_02670 [Candidatus Jorgensenbacteria bacterium CG11_big_fil_rev_8_21_14_0_20_38_23]PIV13116.1 MAG: hypothetical protein COS46_01890 [Candidatus Jorgensenbacteria bacterium CG03_land_8_20_14_0_80_38_39]PIY96514.1 MAG: hypothetical protein COY65_00370 [Candidatus Jorgensenbacteria bacterium CG_4_10_14_0_8_um_filter_39_13]PJA94957.1 MAG: hypothetical protein CO130_01585 [Candidatus Jorgensenbacteria bacterium CG_4_9_14_3_um_filter_38_10]